MGWLFGRKKVPRVPFPEGRPFEEGSLRLPGKLSSSRVIEPDQVKEAAGLGRALTFPEEEELPQPSFPSPRSPPPLSAAGAARPSPLDLQEISPLFVKMDVYQHLVGELDEIKSKITELNHINKSVEKSEYNEEHNFVKLRRAVRGIHDRLLLADKIIFKA